MKNTPPCTVTEDLWSKLRSFTDARIGLGRVGISMPVSENLKFKLAHAQARDAVHQPFDTDALVHLFQQAKIPCKVRESAVKDRNEYLTRPDKGRVLNIESRTSLSEEARGWDISLVVCDGLSTRAVHENCPDFLIPFWQLATDAKYSIAPVQIVRNGRVAIGDEIGELLAARLTVVLIGERPGLSSPNSLGIYMTYEAKAGCTDETRNCISNVREKGMRTEEAIQKLAYLIEKSLSEAKSGVLLKDKMQSNYLPFATPLKALTD